MSGGRRAGGKAGKKSCEAAVKGCGASKCPEVLGAEGVCSIWEQCLSWRAELLSWLAESAYSKRAGLSVMAADGAAATKKRSLIWDMLHLKSA